MALQLGALRDALLDAGATPAKADKAAEEAAGYESRLGSIETKIDRLEAEMKMALAETLRWVIGALGIQTVIIIGAVVALARLHQ